MEKAKNITTALIVVLVVIVMLQNTQAVETKLLFVTVSMPRALLLVVTCLVGMAGGFILSGFWFKRRQDKE